MNRYASLNPLSLRDTAMPPNLLMVAKLLTVCFFVSGEWARLPEPFLPFLGFLDDVVSPGVFAAGLRVAFVVAAALLLTNRCPRAASLALGAVLVLAMLASRNYVENNRFFVCLLFLLCGLSDRAIGARLVQLQVGLLYLGAALNKLLEVDWRSGQYFDYIASHSPLAHAYSEIGRILPSMLLSGLLAWGVIVTEFALAGAFFARRFVPIAIWVGIAYHTSLVLITGRTFGMFWFAATASYLAFVTYPAHVRVSCGWRDAACRRLQRALAALDHNAVIVWEPAADRGLRAESGAVAYRGAGAVLRLGLALPGALVAFYAFAALPMINHRAVAGLVLVLLGGFAASVPRVALSEVWARRGGRIALNRAASRAGSRGAGG